MLLSVSKVTVAQRVCWKSRMNASTASASNVELLQGERVQRIGRFGKRDSRRPRASTTGGEEMLDDDFAPKRPAGVRTAAPAATSVSAKTKSFSMSPSARTTAAAAQYASC